MNIDSQGESTTTTKVFNITLDDGRKVVYKEFLDEDGKFLDDFVEDENGVLDDADEVIEAIRKVLP